MARSNLTLSNVLPYILMVAGVLGVISSFALIYDKIQLLENPGYVPSCNFNPIISCGGVMQSPEAGTFSYLNPIVGLAAFSALGAIGLALIAGARFKRWFWLLLNAGLLGAIGLVHWLFVESVYRINALCPWCMTVWVITITTFWYVTLYNVDHKNLRLPKGRARAVYAWLRGHHVDIVIAWLLIITALILKHFWYYYGRGF